jgi:hypothetical protein
VPGESVACEADRFTADAARIMGHADLRGLVVNKGDLSARDAEITGQLLLATPDKLRPGALPLPDGGHARVLRGGVDLEGAKAARLVLTSKIVAADAACGVGEAAFMLSRCQFGQLRVLGFGGPSHRKRFAPSISLAAITVGDWGVDADTESLPLLEATAFDGRNYVDVEQRLAKIGKKNLADRVYRSMLRRGASGWGARLLNRANYYFSGNGTVPALMFGWLLLCLLPVVIILTNPANVEFTAPPSLRDSDARPYDLEHDWDWVKAAGLASSYALPFLGGSKADVVRARLVGPTCVALPAGLPFVKPPRAAPAGAGVAPRSSACAQVLAVPVSPHELAMMFSTIQFMLWILVAANLPVIARRRP